MASGSDDLVRWLSAGSAASAGRERAVRAWLEGVAGTTTRAFFGVTYGLLLAAPAAKAQAPSRVDGRILDAVTQSPVGGAEVSLGDLRGTSRSNGEFSFGSVASGRTKLQVRMIGYEPWSTVIDVVPGL